SNVIAKRCLKTRAVAEQNIYREVLPLLAFSSLEHYGLSEESESGYCWSFIEDAGGLAYSSDERAHGVLAAGWLGRMHTEAQKAARELGLTCWGPDRYLESLRAGHERICQNLANPALSEEERAVLGKILTECSVVERNWSRLENLCRQMP